jgi:hypothetical protein
MPSESHIVTEMEFPTLSPSASAHKEPLVVAKPVVGEAKSSTADRVAQAGSSRNLQPQQSSGLSRELVPNKNPVFSHRTSFSSVVSATATGKQKVTEIGNWA